MVNYFYTSTMLVVWYGQPETQAQAQAQADRQEQDRAERDTPSFQAEQQL